MLFASLISAYSICFHLQTKTGVPLHVCVQVGSKLRLLQQETEIKEDLMTSSNILQCLIVGQKTDFELIYLTRTVCKQLDTNAITVTFGIS